MKIKSQRDFLSGLLFIGGGVAFAVLAARQPLVAVGEPGSGSLSLALGIVLAVLGAAVLFKSLTIETEGGDRIGPPAWRVLSCHLGAVCAFALLLPRAGLVCAVPCLVLGAALAQSGTGWRSLAIQLVAWTTLCGVLAGPVLHLDQRLHVPLWPHVAGA